MILLLILVFSATDLESLYVHREYEKVIAQVPLLLLDTTLSKTEIIEANKFYAFSLVAVGKIEEAIKVFHRLLDLDPYFIPDPIKISPKIVNVFDEAKTKKLLLMPPAKPLLDTVYIKRKIPLTIFIPGVYQIQNNKKFKGYTIITAGIISLTALGVSQFYYAKSRDEYLAAEDPLIINEKYEVYDGWHKKRIIFISTTTVIWLYNIVDALFFQ